MPVNTPLRFIDMLNRRLLRIKVVKALYSHFKSENDSLSVSEKNLLFGVDKTYQLYHLLLLLIVDLHHYAERRIEAGKAKMLPTPEDLNPNTKFVDNKVIAQIAASDDLLTFTAANGLSWSNYPELIKKLYANMTSKEYYKEYMSSGKGSYAEDKQFVTDFYINDVEDFEELSEVIEEQSIYWADDVEYALVIVVKTLQGMSPHDKEVKLSPKFKSDDDRLFAQRLFGNAVVNSKEYFELVDKNTKNWDFDRIAYMDRIIMLATIAELVSCPTIPVKVTLDEYIEISKYYSTPASGTFINGVLDKIVETLTKEGRIKKEGRGLVES